MAFWVSRVSLVGSIIERTASQTSKSEWSFNLLQDSRGCRNCCWCQLKKKGENYFFLESDMWFFRLFRRFSLCVQVRCRSGASSEIRQWKIFLICTILYPVLVSAMSLIYVIKLDTFVTLVLMIIFCHFCSANVARYLYYLC